MNLKANEWHPFKGLTPGVAVLTRQQVRLYLRKLHGDAEGKAMYRGKRGLPELDKRDNWKSSDVTTRVAETFK